MDRRHILRFVLVIEVIVFIVYAATFSRDYQDSWVLEGLEVPFMLFVVTYTVVFFSERRISWILALAVACSCIFLIIPSLKYVWFYGTAVDQSVQYSLADYVYDQGRIATSVTSEARHYTGTPLGHLSLAIFSTILGVQVVDSMKFLPILLSPIYPLLTYCIIRMLKVRKEANVLKYALFVSSIPIFGASYLVTGSLFGVPLSFLALYNLVALLEKSDRRYWFLFIFFVFALAMTHSVSSMLLTMLLSITILLQKFFYSGMKRYLKIQAVFTVVSISVAWLMFQTEATLETVVHLVSIGIPSGKPPTATFIPPRFFELAQVDLLGAMKVLLVFHGADVFLLLLTLAGLIILMKMRKKANASSNFLFSFTFLVFLLLPLGLLARVGGFRLLRMVGPVFPIFCGLLLAHLSSKKAWLTAIIFSLIILLATLQIYRCQPLIPSANVLSKELSISEPIVYLTQINSIYQRQMIKFAREHVKGRIACDGTTRNQILGLAEYNFSIAQVIYWGYSPLEESNSELEYNFFLIHFPGVSGPFREQAEYRTRDLIVEVICNSSIMYTNGESYVLVHDTE